MKKIITVGLIALLSIWLPNIVWAQIQGVSKGNIVRISAPTISDTLITGKVDSVGTDFVHVSQDSSGYLLIPLDAVDQMQLQTIKSKTRQGALVGAAVGAMILGTMSLASNDTCGPDEWCIIQLSGGESFLVGAAVGLLPGAFIGGFIGTGMKEVTWETIDFTLSEQATASIRLSTEMPGITFKVSM